MHRFNLQNTEAHTGTTHLREKTRGYYAFAVIAHKHAAGGNVTLINLYGQLAG